jgi:hypothetical protein
MKRDSGKVPIASLALRTTDEEERALGRWKTAGLCGAAFCTYLLIILQLGTLPFSDFKVYYETALEIVQGKSFSSFYKYFGPPGYPYFLAFFFGFFKTTSILLPQLLNAFMLTILLWVFLRYPFINHPISLVAGFLVMAFNVNCLSLVSVLCTEILYVFFLILGLFEFGVGLKRTVGSKRMGIGGMLAFGSSQSVRPITFVYLSILSLFVVMALRYFTVRGERRPWESVFFLSLQSLGPTAISFLTTSLLFYGAVGYGLTFVPHQKGLWNLYVGLNTQSKGRFNSQDADLIVSLGEASDWHAATINGRLKPLIYDRIQKDWKGNLRMLPEKLNIFLNPKAIPFFSIEHSRIVDKLLIYRISSYLTLINAFVLILSLAAWVVWLVKRDLSDKEIFAFCLLGASFVHVLLHALLLEVQERYSTHLWLIMFWCFPLSWGTIWKNSVARIRTL